MKTFLFCAATTNRNVITVRGSCEPGKGMIHQRRLGREHWSPSMKRGREFLITRLRYFFFLFFFSSLQSARRDEAAW